MARFTVRHDAPEWTPEKKQRLVDAFEAAAVEILGSSETAVSVDEVDVDPADRQSDVVDVEIIRRLESLLRRPGYPV